MQYKNARGQTLEEFLSKYDASLYQHPSVTVDIAVFTLLGDELGVLLIERRDHPCIFEWALPGGFLEIDEEASSAAARELYEETTVKGLPIREFGVFSKVGRDPRTRNISLAHLAIAPSDILSPKAADDAKAAELFLVHTNNKSGKLYVSLSSCKSNDIELRYTANITHDAFSGYAVNAEKGDLAFDHSLILTHALISLLSIDRDTVLSMLAPHDIHCASRALSKISEDIHG